MIERWEFVHFPCDRDQLRYKLKIKAREEDIPAVIRKLGSNCGKPFTSLSKEFNWAFYIYQVEKEDRNRIIQILKEMSAHGTVHNAAIEVSQELPPMLEEFLDETARSLQGIEDKKDSTETLPDSTATPETHAPSPISEEMPADNQGTEEPTTDEIVGIKINPRYKFENFIVGPNNRFTHAAAQAVAENPGKIYNPLFIYGGVGLGKTHLMHAVAHQALQKNPSTKVVFITTEKFMGEVIEAIGKGSMRSFRERFRNISLLLIDDIQFLAESEATQEEFFHTFNFLFENGKQIIITSDRPPKQLVTLEDRLRSRFEWGLIADIKSPNLETRVAILKRKAIDEHFMLDENMLLYIATKLKSNIRELEGFLKRINAYAEITGKKVDMDLIKMIMKELLPEEEAAETTGEVQAVSPESSQVIQTQTPIEPMRLKPAAIGFSMPPLVTPTLPKTPKSPDLKPILPGVPPRMAPPPGPTPSKLGGENIDPSLTPIEVGFFYPENQISEFNEMKEKFKTIIKKHKLKFKLEAIFEETYVVSGKINYTTFSEECKRHNVRIVIILGPPTDSSAVEDDFANLITAVMEDELISLQLVPWKEKDKDYRYLNLSLDIALLRHRKPNV